MEVMDASDSKTANVLSPHAPYKGTTRLHLHLCVDVQVLPDVLLFSLSFLFFFFQVTLVGFRAFQRRIRAFASSLYSSIAGLAAALSSFMGERMTKDS